MDGWRDEGEREKIRDQGREEAGGGGQHPLLKGLKDIKSFWESDCIECTENGYMVKLMKVPMVWLRTHLQILERAGFISGTLSGSAMQVINMTGQGDVLPQHSCLASSIFPAPI